MHQILNQPIQSRTVPWTAQDAWLGVACLGIWLCLAYGLVAILKLLALDISPGLMVTGMELVLLLPAWGLTRKKYGVSWSHLGLTKFKPRYLGLGLGLFVPSMWLNALYETFLSRFGHKMQPEVERILTETSSPGLFILAAVIIAPLVEEIFFRGFLFAGLKNRFLWTTAMLISSGLFALLHLSPLAAPPIFLLGLVFAYLYQRSGSIWPAVIIHSLVNSLAVIWIYSHGVT